MTRPEDMDRLIKEHLTAEMAGDSSAAVAVYTEDVEHDVVGSPTGAAHGKQAAQGFYDYLMANFRTQEMTVNWKRYGDDFCVVEHQTSGVVLDEFLGVPGAGKHISFRLLHVFDFRDGKISRENVWIDGGAAIAQITGG